jgi:hypothetical protein
VPVIRDLIEETIKSKGSCVCPGDIRLLLLLLLQLVSTNRFSIREPQWHLGAALAFHQQAADEVGGNLLSGATEEGLGEAGRCWMGVVAMGVAL